MRIEFHISQSEQNKFQRACEMAILSVGNGSLSAVTEAAQEIMLEAMNQVPRDTGTLAGSAFVGVSRRSDTKNYRYGAVLGFGQYQGIGGSVGLDGIDWIWPPNNGVNPKSGLRASVYASRVHDDVSMVHKFGGKAKFLEDPVRLWASGRFARTAFRYWKTAIEEIEYYQKTGLSNDRINKMIKSGKVTNPDVAATKQALDKAKSDLLNAPNGGTKAMHQAYSQARINHSMATKAADTYRAVTQSPSSMKQYGNFNSRGRYTGRGYRIVQMRRTDYRTGVVSKGTITKSSSRGK